MQHLKQQAHYERLSLTWDAYVKHSGNVQAVACELGISERTVRDRLRSINRIGIKNIKNLCSNNNECSDSKLSATDSTVNRIHELEEKLKVYESLSHCSTYVIPEFSPSSNHAVPVAVLSDIHIGEVVDPADIPGRRNVYNIDIAKHRIEQFFQRVVYMNSRVARSIAKVDTMVLAMLGDLMTGYINDELRESNAMTPVQEVLVLEELINAGIEYLLSKDSCRTILIPCCHGNHGRITPTMRSHRSADTSYEWMLYRHLAHRWRHEHRLQWFIASAYHQYLKVHDTVLRFHHGDAIAYRDGIGGLTIPLRKAIHQWNSVCYADIDVLGHWHQYIDGGNFIVNGSVIGMSAYAVRMRCSFEPPQQAWFLVDAHRGKTMTARLFTDYMPQDTNG